MKGISWCPPCPWCLDGDFRRSPHVQDRKAIHPEVVARTAKRCRERGIVIPSYAQMRNPELIPEAIKARLKGVGFLDVDPVNLFRITWKNDVKTGLFGGPNYLEIPSAITGVRARIFGLVGKVLPHRRPQGRRGVLLPGAAAGERRVRPREAQGRLAQHRELLPRAAPSTP